MLAKDVSLPPLMREPLRTPSRPLWRMIYPGQHAEGNVRTMAASGWAGVTDGVHYCRLQALMRIYFRRSLRPFVGGGGLGCTWLWGPATYTLILRDAYYSITPTHMFITSHPRFYLSRRPNLLFSKLNFCASFFFLFLWPYFYEDNVVIQALNI